MRQLFRLLLVVVMFLNFSLGEGAVPPKPTRDIYVQDLAGVMDSESKAKILQIGRALDEKTTAQVVVVTVPSLEGQDLESYSLELMRAWGIGQKDKNNGVLLLLAVKERKSRIEVGYGLEGDLPDGKTGRIQDEYMLPAFKEGKYGQGLLQGYGAIAQVIEKSAAGVTQEPAAFLGDSVPIWAVLGIIILLPIGIFFGMSSLLRSINKNSPSRSGQSRYSNTSGTFTRSKNEESQNWLEIILYIIMILLRGGGGGRGGGGNGGGGFGGGSGGGGGSSRGF